MGWGGGSPGTEVKIFLLLVTASGPFLLTLSSSFWRTPQAYAIPLLAAIIHRPSWLTPWSFLPVTPPQSTIPSPLNDITSWSAMQHPSSKSLSQSPLLWSSQHIHFTILTLEMSRITSDLLVQWQDALLFHCLIFASCSDFPCYPTLSLWSSLPCILFAIT